MEGGENIGIEILFYMGVTERRIHQESISEKEILEPVLREERN